MDVDAVDDVSLGEKGKNSYTMDIALKSAPPKFVLEPNNSELTYSKRKLFDFSERYVQNLPADTSTSQKRLIIPELFHFEKRQFFASNHGKGVWQR